MTRVRDCIFLKLGGSLISNKREAETPRHDVIQRLAAEIVRARDRRPDLDLIIGHGSGSFGHVVGRRYGTRAGVETAEQWYGFAATADAAARLNRLLVTALLDAGVPAWTIQPSVDIRCLDGRITAGPEKTVRAALDCGLVPVVHGDVALDSERGGTIVSTEEIFQWLAPFFEPTKMILLGEVDGVYTADPQIDDDAVRIAVITPSLFEELRTGLGRSHGVDVTGGMLAKVRQALLIAKQNPGLDVQICSGLIPNALCTTLVETGLARSQDRSDSDAWAGTHIYG